MPRTTNLRRYYGPVAVVRRTGLRRGVLGGNRRWLIAWLALTALTTAKRQISRHPQFVSVDTLRPGERVSIRTIPVQSAKERKQLLRGQN